MRRISFTVEAEVEDEDFDNVLFQNILSEMEDLVNKNNMYLFDSEFEEV